MVGSYIGRHTTYKGLQLFLYQPNFTDESAAVIEYPLMVNYQLTLRLQIIDPVFLVKAPQSESVCSQPRSVQGVTLEMAVP